MQGHGPDGLGGEAGLAAAERRVARRNDAVHALIELGQAHAGELVVIAIGPLTNVALAMLLEPAFARNLRRLVVMGGLSRGEGNSTPHAEFNVACDPEATHIVYEHCSADQLVVVPFETCADNTLSWETFDRVFCNENKPTSAYIRKIWRFNRSFSPEGFLPCDAYAVAVLLHDRYVTKSKRVRGAIHLAHDERRGACVWQEDCTPKDANATLVTEVDKAVFVQLLENLAA
jgi:purine nucleosidase